MAGHFRGKAQARYVDLADLAGVGNGLCGGNDTDRGRRDDRLQVRIGLNEPLGFAIGLVGKVVAIDGCYDVDALVVALDLLHLGDPGVLVGRGRGSREHGDVAALRQVVGGQLDDHVADQRVRRRVEVHQPAILGDTAVPGDDLDAAVHRLLQRRHQGVGVVGRNGDRIDLLGDQRVDHLDLAFGGGRGRAGVDHLDVAQFLGGFLGALVGSFEEADAERLDDERDLLVFRMRGIGHQRKRNRGRDHQ
ncbi:hypothetical protein D9M72_500470 [compost metagenome]